MRIQLSMTLTIVHPNRFRSGTQGWRICELYRNDMTVRELLANALPLGLSRSRVITVLNFSARNGHIELRDRWGRLVAAEAMTPTTAPTAPWSPSQVTSDTAIPSGERTFGVELEIFMPIGMTMVRLAQLVTAGGVVCRFEGYNHYQRSWWKVVTDGSLGDYTRGAEIVSPILTGEAGLEQLTKVCRVLVEHGVTVNRRCGFHVHVGARGEQIDFFKRLVNLYGANETLIDSVLPPSRRNNVYCKSMQPHRATLDRVSAIHELQRQFTDRYLKINIAAYWRHGTVEFRQHSGTIEADKATAWVRLCLKMVAVARSAVAIAQSANLNEFLTLLGCNAEEHSFFNRRAARFAAIRGEVA